MRFFKNVEMYGLKGATKVALLKLDTTYQVYKTMIKSIAKKNVDSTYRYVDRELD